MNWIAIATALAVGLGLAACQTPGKRRSVMTCSTLPNSAGVLYKVCRDGDYVEYERVEGGRQPN